MAVIVPFLIEAFYVIDTVVSVLAISFALDLIVQSIIGVPSSTTTNNIDGAQMSDTAIPSSHYSTPIHIPFGKTRSSTSLIWAKQIKEEIQVEVAESITDGGKAGYSVTQSTTTSYEYTASFACLVCDGPIQQIDAIMLNGKTVQADTMANHVRVYLGTETQMPDPTIQAAIGPENTPAYRDRAYIVFTDMPLEAFGNRIPEVACIITSVSSTVGDIIDSLMQRVDFTRYHVPIELRAIVINGMSVTNHSPLRSSIQVLAATYNFIISERDGKLNFIKGRSG